MSLANFITDKAYNPQHQVGENYIVFNKQHFTMLQANLHISHHIKHSDIVRMFLQFQFFKSHSPISI